MRWRLIIEEFGPKLTYIKGASNIVADALSRMRMTEKDFGPEVFATDAEAGDFPANFPLSYKQLAYAQRKDRKIQSSLKTKAGKERFVMKTFRHSDKSYELITYSATPMYLPNNATCFPNQGSAAAHITSQRAQDGSSPRSS
jgi:hypothetical protein